MSNPTKRGSLVGSLDDVHHVPEVHHIRRPLLPSRVMSGVPTERVDTLFLQPTHVVTKPATIVEDGTWLDWYECDVHPRQQRALAAALMQSATWKAGQFESSWKSPFENTHFQAY